MLTLMRFSNMKILKVALLFAANSKETIKNQRDLQPFRSTFKLTLFNLVYNCSKKITYAAEKNLKALIIVYCEKNSSPKNVIDFVALNAT